jgi:hypothetical protein
MSTFDPMKPLLFPEDAVARLEHHFRHCHDVRWAEVHADLVKSKRLHGGAKGWVGISALEQNNLVENHGRDFKKALVEDLRLDWAPDIGCGLDSASRQLHKAVAHKVKSAPFADLLVHPGSGPPPLFPWLLKAIGFFLAMATTALFVMVVKVGEPWQVFAGFLALMFLFGRLWSGAGPPLSEEALVEFVRGKRLAKTAAFSSCVLLSPLLASSMEPIQWSYLGLAPLLAVFTYSIATKQNARFVKEVKLHFSFRLRGMLIEPSILSELIERKFDVQILNIQRGYWNAYQRLGTVTFAELDDDDEGRERLVLWFEHEALSKSAKSMKDKLTKAFTLLTDTEKNSTTFKQFEDKLDRATEILDALGEGDSDEDVVFEVPQQEHPSALRIMLAEGTDRRVEAGQTLQAFLAAYGSKKRASEMRDTVAMQETQDAYQVLCEQVEEQELTVWAKALLPHGEHLHGHEEVTSQLIEEYLSDNVRNQVKRWGRRLGKGLSVPSYEEVESLLRQVFREELDEQPEEKVRLLDELVPIYLVVLHQALSDLPGFLDEQRLLNASRTLDDIPREGRWLDEVSDAAHGLAGYLASIPVV